MNVWYASYGSNILEDRFMCYINGTKAPGSSEKEIGCTDKTAPKSSRQVELPYPLYFAKKRSKWGEGGVAFISHERSNEEKTIGRMYLISEEQFLEVVSQENKSPHVPVNLHDVTQKGSQQIDDGWYGTILYVGDENGSPVFTFTNNQPIDDVQFNKPSAAYLSTIANGLLNMGWKRNEVVDYFLDKSGIAGQFTFDSLETYIFGG